MSTVLTFKEDHKCDSQLSQLRGTSESSTSTQNRGVDVGLHRQVEALIHCLGPGSVCVVVASASILGACEGAVGESPGKSSTNAAGDASEAVAC